jgi:tRNA A-37 threonylcarbamoyl transferase component Bud32
MPLAPGQSISHYRLVEKIGEGGMGVVWKARDARLNRDVAIKVLPPELSDNAKRLVRFQREARILASLQDPNVASIYGLEESEGEHFLVMELVEGEDLAQRLRRGPVPVEEALDVARQLAEGLETAHEKGIVHRDLKPANVKLTPDGKVKVLDFGLAKAFTEESMEESDEPSRSPTLTAEATRAGVILGTAAYMSPEQARGRLVDRRTDIWAFGCVLYEMLAGTRPFMGETVSDTLAEVLKSEADWSLLPKETPVRVSGLIKLCLRKDPKERLRDIGDARLELAEVLAGAPEMLAAPEATSRRLSAWTWAAACLLAGALLAAVGLRILTPAPPAPELRKLTIPIPQLGTGWGTAARVSPDGHRIAYFGDGRLWVRDLRRFEAAEIPGSEGATHQFWSPESGKIGFAKEGKIWTWTLGGGQSTSICRIPAAGEGSNGGAWSRDGRIYFATFRGGLYEVAAVGGEPRLILSPDPSEVDFHLPYLLPDGTHLLMAGHRKTGPHPIIVFSLREGTRRNLEGYEGLLSVTPSPTGHLLLYLMESRPKILALPFSESRLEVMGDPFLVAAGGKLPSVSSNGLLIYSLGSSSGLRELVWVDREGHTGQVVGRPRLGLNSPAISPDGRQVAVVAYENENADIWIQDLARGTWSRLLSGPESEISPIWSPSGDRIFYLKEERNFFDSLMEVPVDGSGAPRKLAEGVEGPPVSASPDGRTLVFMVEKEGRFTLWRLDLKAAAEPVRISSNTSVSEAQPAISPDGRWLAFASDESGSQEVFIRPFPGGGQRQQVSLNGGSDPFWSRRGDALFYWESEVLMEVPVKVGAALTPGTARRLFSAAAIGLDPLEDAKPALDVASDGRFLIARRANEDPRRGLLLVESWFEEYRKR